MVVTYEAKTPRPASMRQASATAFANLAGDYHWRGGGLIPVKTACKRTKFDRDVEIGAFHRLLAIAHGKA